VIKCGTHGYKDINSKDLRILRWLFSTRSLTDADNCPVLLFWREGWP